MAHDAIAIAHARPFRLDACAISGKSVTCTETRPPSRSRAGESRRGVGFTKRSFGIDRNIPTRQPNLGEGAFMPAMPIQQFDEFAREEVRGIRTRGGCLWDPATASVESPIPRLAQGVTDEQLIAVLAPLRRVSIGAHTARLFLPRMLRRRGMLRVVGKAGPWRPVDDGQGRISAERFDRFGVMETTRRRAVVQRLTDEEDNRVRRLAGEPERWPSEFMRGLVWAWVGDDPDANASEECLRRGYAPEDAAFVRYLRSLLAMWLSEQRASGVATHQGLVKWLGDRNSKSHAAAEMALGGSWNSRGRLDAVTLTIGESGEVVVEGVEAKKTRADLRRDLRSDKWRQYLPFLDRFYFALYEGVSAKDIPPEVGIYRFAGGEWSVERESETFEPSRSDADVISRFLKRSLAM